MIRKIAPAVVLAVGVASCGGNGRSEKAAVSQESSTSPSAAAPKSFTVAATGDVLIHPPLTDQAAVDARSTHRGKYDFEPMFAGIKPVISAADLAICHMETPLAPANGPFIGYPTFSAPPQVTNALADMGYDTCSTASNHTLDQGQAGVNRTLDQLDSVGIRHTGSARSAQEATRINMLTVQGVKVAQLSYAFGFNGFQAPADKPWLANQIDKEAILAAAKKARAAGAEVVILSLHWGIEYQHSPTTEQRKLARDLLADPNIDLIVGHHAHVTQPFEKINGKWVAYGLGNMIARHSEPRGDTEEGLVAQFRFTQDNSGHWQVTNAEYVPTYIDLASPIRLVDVPTALRDSGLTPQQRTRYEKVQADTDRVVDSLGATKQGLHRVGD